MTELSLNTSSDIYYLMSTATGTAVASATLLDSASNPVPNQTYTFNYQLEGAPSFTEAGTAVTNPSGVATFTYTLPPGTYIAQAVFAGGNGYNGSTGISASFQITVNTTTTVIITSVT